MLHALPPSEWLEIDRYAVALTAQLQKEVLSHYDVYEFHPVVASCRPSARKTWAASTSTC